MKNEFKRKKFGQHFLNNELIAEEIVSFADIKKNETVLEIGPGKGILTSILLKRANKVIAVEIDDTLVKYLKKRFSKTQNLSLIHEDFLKFKLPNLTGKIKVIGNLPYNIGVRIIKFMTNHKDGFSKIIFMLQKEVAERLAASPGIKEYGSLSIFTQLHYDLEILMHISPESFSPPPKVFSTLVKMQPKKEALRQLDNPELFQKVVKSAFSHRRKKLKNNLRCFSIGQNDLKVISQETGIDLDMRGEMLSIEEFISLTQSINKIT
jgi:16S rRNA (adenine1518-N6/adenine1519-N6)-dimethyltransferase